MTYSVRNHLVMVRVPGSVMDAEPWKVSTALASCVVYRAQYMHEWDAYEYVIARGDFPEKHRGQVPLYVDVDWHAPHPHLRLD